MESKLIRGLPIFTRIKMAFFSLLFEFNVVFNVGKVLVM